MTIRYKRVVKSALATLICPQGQLSSGSKAIQKTPSRDSRKAKPKLKLS